ncbi:MAG: ATP-dependent helicase [Muribaculaceae bacterium]|nr:ATP-dependent helicase [Muribaculaceae bacterium]
MNFEELNPQQRDAASYEGRNLLVLAGAGTGKTRTIIARAKYLLEKGVSPSRLLILSFTRKSAKEIVARLQSSTQGDTRALKGQTFHSWCMEIIEQNPGVFNFGKFTVIDEEDRESAFRLVCGRHFKKSNFIEPKQLAEVYSYVVNARCNLTTALSHRLFNGRMDEETKEKILRKLPVYQEVIKKYMAFKAERHYLDYDDILQKVALGLKKNPAAADFIAGSFDHILIDEMQDTNPLQYLLLESFWTRCNLFCVGDDAQSIYGFRGADFKSIHYFPLVVPDSNVKKLTINYRSTQEILDLSNWVLERSPLNYDKKLIAERGKGIKPVICHFHQEWDMSRDIVMRIKNSQGEEKCPYKENMVLSRSNWGLKSVEACLIEAQIPYTVYGGTSIMASAHVRDIVSALRVVANPRDELAWERYLCLFPRIGEITAAKIIDKIIDKDSLEECLEILEGEKGLDPDIATTLLNIKMLEIEVNRAIEAAMRGLQKVLAHKYRDDWNRRRKDITLLERIGAASESLTAFLSDYILDPSLGTGVKGESDPEDCVILTTIHSAKGLEARNCYLINVNFNQYPSSKAVANGEDAIEEDRRCLYVALTRAKDKLVIYRSHKAAQVIDASDMLSFEASKLYFLNDLPETLYDVENIGATSREWGFYKGDSISLSDCEEFDFS